MTASDLYEIVKDVPREAWPELEWEDGWFVDTEQTSAILTSVAESAFVGSMTAWLPLGWVVGKCEGHDCPDGRDATHMVYNVNEEGEYVGTSLVAALAAACKEVGNG